MKVNLLNDGPVTIIIPAKYAYGSTKMDNIPAWSTLEFDLELVKIAQI